MNTRQISISLVGMFGVASCCAALALGVQDAAPPKLPKAAGPSTAVRQQYHPPAASTLPYEEYRIVPVRVHLLRDTETPAAGCHLKEADIVRIFGKVNGIWHAAGVHLWVESIVTETSASTAGFEHAETLPTNALKALRPTDSRKAELFHVYYMGSMPPNGIFMG